MTCAHGTAAARHMAQKPKSRGCAARRHLEGVTIKVQEYQGAYRHDREDGRKVSLRKALGRAALYREVRMLKAIWISDDFGVYLRTAQA
ncbi:MAG: hypothetical protein FD153_309 [Rhodospirillaceae bacterium]|nr:MAG: hypothetical protein FD153_309 [Rhodospirillaceae bacterium]